MVGGVSFQLVPRGEDALELVVDDDRGGMKTGRRCNHLVVLSPALFGPTQTVQFSNGERKRNLALASCRHSRICIPSFLLSLAYTYLLEVALKQVQCGTQFSLRYFLALAAEA
jgi:hypothetical protein